MTQKNAREETVSGDSPRAPRKPYLKPEFRYERAFETMALACGKMRRSAGSTEKTHSSVKSGEARTWPCRRRGSSARSREAAKECSPRRKPWVKNGK
jgi:hypothetical protein